MLSEMFMSAAMLCGQASALPPDPVPTAAAEKTPAQVLLAQAKPMAIPAPPWVTPSNLNTSPYLQPAEQSSLPTRPTAAQPIKAAVANEQQPATAEPPKPAEPEEEPPAPAPEAPP